MDVIQNIQKQMETEVAEIKKIENGKSCVASLTVVRIQKSCLKQANYGWKEEWKRHGVVRVQDAGWGCKCLQVSWTDPC